MLALIPKACTSIPKVRPFSHSLFSIPLPLTPQGGPVDEAQTLLDDHIIKSQAMSASPFAKPFLDRLVPWEKKLVRFQVGGDGEN